MKTQRFLAHFVGFILIVGVVAIVEFLMGRIWYCKCGYVLWWYGDTNGPGNSQHISDWYTLSHFIHGILFYGILHVISKWIGKRKMLRGEVVLPGGHAISLGTRFLLALGLEGAWEILENTPFIINRYRSVTLAHDYIGDSILNSVMDVVTAGLGFLFSRKVSVKLLIVLCIALEVLAAYYVRDNLTLNVIMLLYPMEAIKTWQMGI